MSRNISVLEKSSSLVAPPLPAEAFGAGTIRDPSNGETEVGEPPQIAPARQPCLPDTLQPLHCVQARQRLNAIVRRNSVLMGRVPARGTCPRPAQASGEYRDLIRRLFHAHSVIAIVGGPRSCEGIAAELAQSGDRVVVVAVNALLAHPSPYATSCLNGRVPNVYRWPASAGLPLEFFGSTEPRPAAPHWLDTLRRDFDSVLLDCPDPEVTPPAAEIAALADAAVLVVRAGRTTRRQIRHDQRTLELAGVRLAGCIFSRRR